MKEKALLKRRKVTEVDEMYSMGECAENVLGCVALYLRMSFPHFRGIGNRKCCFVWFKL